jgi:AcrR family transcriptional regulator
MKGTEKKQAQSPIRTALLESAVALFNEKGYDSVTIEEIAKRAGTAKGSFYTYFSTKSDILIEEYLRIDDYCRLFSRNLDRNTDAREKLFELTRGQLRYIRDQVGLEPLKHLYVNNILGAGSEKALLDKSRASHKLVLEILREGQAAGEVRTDLSVDRLALFHERAQRSVCLDWILSNNGFDLVTEGETVCETITASFLAARG